MIFTYLLSIPALMVIGLFGVLHIPFVTVLPYGVDNFVALGIGYVNTILYWYPWLAVFLQALRVMILFEIAYFTLRLIRVIPH